MAEVKAAIRSSKDRLHQQMLKRITYLTPAATKHAIGCKPHQDTSIELAALKWNTEMLCTFDIVGHHPISPLIAMVVELNSP